MSIEEQVGTAPGARTSEPRYPTADILGVLELLDPAERAFLARARGHFQSQIRPAALGHWERAEFPFEVVPGLAELGIGGIGVTHGSHLLAGLVHLELTRADTSVGTFFGVHNELFIAAVVLLGSDRHRAELLPDLLALRTVGAFALTEPDHGSDISRSIATTATLVNDEWVIQGRKRWIGNGTFADSVLVWAVDTADGQIKGFIVERDRPGFTSTLIGDKTAVRSVQNADLLFDSVRIPFDNWLPGTRSFADTNTLLCNSRTWVAWQAVGQQFAAFDVARDYALMRHQFGKPVASFQIVQEQLARMLGNATMCLSTLIQLARMQEKGSLTMDQAALAKAMCSLRMRETVALGRSILGGNGVSLEFEMAKIFADAEAIYSYEGTYEINSLIVGRSITGISAF